MAAVQFWAGRDLKYTDGTSAYGTPSASTAGVLYGLNSSSLSSSPAALLTFEEPRLSGALISRLGTGSSTQGTTWYVILLDGEGVPICRITRLSSSAGLGFNLEEWDADTEEYQLVAFDMGYQDGSPIGSGAPQTALRWGDGQLLWELGRFPLTGLTNYARVTFEYALPRAVGAVAMKHYDARLFYGVLSDDPSVDIHRYRVIAQNLSSTPVTSVDWVVGQVTGSSGYAVGPNDVVPATTYATTENATLAHTCTFTATPPLGSRVLKVRAYAVMSPDGTLDADVQLMAGATALGPSDPVAITEATQLVRHDVDVPITPPAIYGVGVTLVPR